MRAIVMENGNINITVPKELYGYSESDYGRFNIGDEGLLYVKEIGSDKIISEWGFYNEHEQNYKEMANGWVCFGFYAIGCTKEKYGIYRIKSIAKVKSGYRFVFESTE